MKVPVPTPTESYHLAPETWYPAPETYEGKVNYDC